MAQMKSGNRHAVTVVAGLPAGPIMSLPSLVLRAETRALGMGVFFTLHYGCSLGGPVAGGWIAEATGDPADVFLG